MLKNLEELIRYAKGESDAISDKLISLAAKIRKETLHGKRFLTLDVEEMESWIDPSKVDEEVSIGRVELEL